MVTVTTADPHTHTLRDAGEVIGFVAIDSSVNGRARGGLRMLPDVNAEELGLAARSMTLKYGFLGLPQGGAKAGVIGHPERPIDERRQRLLAFARAAHDLLRDERYVPDSDMGTQTPDIRWMMEASGCAVRARDWRSDRSGRHTATSCLASARAALAHRGRDLSGCRVAIEGFGHVGGSLAEQLRAAGASIVAISTSAGALYAPEGLDVQELRRLAARSGSSVTLTYSRAERVPLDALLELPVDLLCPCARHSSVHGGNASRVSAPFVCAGANNPITPDAERTLWQRGVIVPPDFISNSGGVLGGTLEFAGVSAARAGRTVARVIEPAVRRLLAEADAAGVQPRSLAEPLALARHARVSAAAGRPNLPARVLNVGLDWYRRGWLPGVFVGAMAPVYLERRLQA